MVEAADSDLIISKRKAISTLLPYAIFLEEEGQQGMINAILDAARVSDSSFSNLGKFMWCHVVPYVSRLFEERSSTSLNRVITLISPYVPRESWLDNQTAVSRWAKAALAIPRTEEVGQRVVDALFQIASFDSLRPHIPTEIWSFLKNQPPLPPVYCGIQWAGYVGIVAHVRSLKDIELLKSYFLLVWTDRHNLLPQDLREMESSIREDFGGSGSEMEHHREDLIGQLDRVLSVLGRGPRRIWLARAVTQFYRIRESVFDPLDRLVERLDRGQAYPSVRRAKRRYTKLRNVLLEVDGRLNSCLLSPMRFLFNQRANFLWICRDTVDYHLCSPSSVFVVLGWLALLPRVRTLVPALQSLASHLLPSKQSQSLPDAHLPIPPMGRSIARHRASLL